MIFSPSLDCYTKERIPGKLNIMVQMRLKLERLHTWKAEFTVSLLTSVLDVKGKNGQTPSIEAETKSNGSKWN